MIVEVFRKKENDLLETLVLLILLIGPHLMWKNSYWVTLMTHVVSEEVIK